MLYGQGKKDYEFNDNFFLVSDAKAIADSINIT